MLYDFCKFSVEKRACWVVWVDDHNAFGALIDFAFDIGNIWLPVVCFITQIMNRFTPCQIRRRCPKRVVRHWNLHFIAIYPVMLAWSSQSVQRTPLPKYTSATSTASTTLVWYCKIVYARKIPFRESGIANGIGQIHRPSDKISCGASNPNGQGCKRIEFGLIFDLVSPMRLGSSSRTANVICYCLGSLLIGSKFSW